MKKPRLWPHSQKSMREAKSDSTTQGKAFLIRRKMPTKLKCSSSSWAPGNGRKQLGQTYLPTGKNDKIWNRISTQIESVWEGPKQAEIKEEPAFERQTARSTGSRAGGNFCRGGGKGQYSGLTKHPEGWGGKSGTQRWDALTSTYKICPNLEH